MKRILFLALLMAASGFSFAETITRQDYVRRFLEADPDLLSARQGLITARRKRDLSLSQWLPSAAASASTNVYGHDPNAGYARDEGRFAFDRFHKSASLSLNVFNSFKDFYSYAGARADLNAAERNLEESLQTAVLNASELYETLRLRRELLRVAEENYKINQDRLDLTRRQYQGGFKSLSDLRKSETDAGTSELNLLEAQAASRLALARFNLAVQRPIEESVELASQEEPGAAPLIVLSDALAIAQKNRPEMLEAEARLRSSKWSLRQRAQGFFPTLSADLKWNWSEAATYGAPRIPPSHPNPNYQGTLSLSLPFGYNVWSQWQEYAAVKAAFTQAELAFEKIRRRVEEEVFERALAVERLEKAVKIARQKMKNAKENYDLLLTRYRQGSASVLELAEGQRDASQAEVQYLESLRDYSLGLIRIRAAVGEKIWE